MSKGKRLEIPSIRWVFDDQNKARQKGLIETWVGVTGKTERNFYYRLDNSSLTEYVIFAKFLGTTVDALLGKELIKPVDKTSEYSDSQLAASLGLSKPKEQVKA